ncbi:sulfurtransferase TusA family protein [Intrasporangium calvum]|uniref:Sulfurtransferase TusA family protein n=1 Tax=Intrasporangium calvum TaxID=53358 RepID=A0ABT5GG73_9MICO|nr:sulfurtransferase TusA family protein [Intrasporangium calvum]MDC5696706.1 sulfurtransferase TusA family protein [Intrasporangium calvum]
MTGAADSAQDEHVVDARGKRCPLPVIELARYVSTHPQARRVVVLATDPAAAHDIPAWCRMRGHDFAGGQQRGDHVAYAVELAR